MNIGHQPRRPVQPLRYSAQKVWRITQHAGGDKAGQRHHTAPCQPALVLVAAVVKSVNLHAIFTLGNRKHAAVGRQLGAFEALHQLLRQPAIALRPGQHLIALFICAMLCRRARRMKTVTAGKVVDAGPGRDPADTRTKVIAAAVIQIPEQALISQPLRRQPLIKTLRIQLCMGRRQLAMALPDANRGHGKHRGTSGLTHLLFKQGVLGKRR